MNLILPNLNRKPVQRIEEGGGVIRLHFADSILEITPVLTGASLTYSLTKRAPKLEPLVVNAK